MQAEGLLEEEDEVESILFRTPHPLLANIFSFLTFKKHWKLRYLSWGYQLVVSQLLQSRALLKAINGTPNSDSDPDDKLD